MRPTVGCGAGGWQNSAVEAADRRLCSSPPLCVGVQVYESKLQELQKQVETISLVAETPDEEELEEEEEEEGVYWKTKKPFGADAVLLESWCTTNSDMFTHFEFFSSCFCPERNLLECMYRAVCLSR